MLHHAISAERFVHHAELKPFTQYQFCTFRNDRDKNCIGKRVGSISDLNHERTPKPT